MKWSDVNTGVGIVSGLVAILSTTTVVVWWERVTNKRKATFWKEKYDLQKIEMKQLRERLETFKTVEDTVKAFKEAAKSSPEVAEALLPYLTDLIK